MFRLFSENCERSIPVASREREREIQGEKDSDYFDRKFRNNTLHSIKSNLSDLQSREKKVSNYLLSGTKHTENDFFFFFFDQLTTEARVSESTERAN